MSTPSIPLCNRATLTVEDEYMLAIQQKVLKQVSFTDAAQETGIHADILRMLVRDGILPGLIPEWPTAAGSCDLEKAQAIADDLNAARQPVEGQGILVTEANQKYGFSSRTIYNWFRSGWVSVVGGGNQRNRLFNEGDIAFARALADLRGHVMGKSVFPAKPRSGRPRKK